jgi:branched-chain amino acid transport system substrate-binding protein
MSSAPVRAQTDAVRIGVLVPTQGPRALDGQAMLEAARMAIDEANQSGPYRGRLFELAVRFEEGIWDGGAREISALVFEEGVSAVMGSVDGRGGHVLQQVVTKGRVPFVTPWATDPTLAQAGVFWFFRCVPDDGAQAGALFDAIYAERDARNVVVLRDAEYDARFGERAFTRHVSRTGKPAPRIIEVSDASADDEALFRRLKAERADAIVLFLEAGPAARIVRGLARAGMANHLFGPMSLADPLVTGAAREAGAGMLVVAPGYVDSPHFAAFEQAYQGRYGRVPRPSAAYAYDAANAIIAAIRAGGTEHRQIWEALAKVHLPGGVTGPVRFTETGNRVATLRMVDIRTL